MSIDPLLVGSLDAINDPIALLDGDGVIIFVNDAWLQSAAAVRHHGPPEELGTSYPELFLQRQGADAAEAALQFRKLIGGEISGFEREYASQAPSGRPGFRMTVKRLQSPGATHFLVRHVAPPGEASMGPDTGEHEANAAFRQFVESSREGVIATDVTGRITYANPMAGELIGLDREQLTGESVFEHMPSTHAFDLRTHFVALWRNHSVTVEASFAQRSGTVVDVLAAVSPLTDGSGLLTGAVIMLSDRRVQKEAERGLRQALQTADLDRRRLEATLAALPVGVWISDANGRLTHSNPAADRIWSGAAPKVDRANYGVYRAWWPDTGLPIQPDEWHLSRTLATGTSFTGEMVGIQRFDDTWGYCLNSTAAIRDESGHIVGGVVALMDVSDREAARKERERLIAQLEAERANLAEIFDKAPSFLVVFRGPDFIIERVNARYQTLVGTRPIVGKPLTQAVPEVPQVSLDRLRHVMETGEPIVVEEIPVHLLRPDAGTSGIRHVSLYYQRIVGAHGDPGVVIHGIDMTEQVEARLRVLATELLLREQFAKIPVPTFLWQVHGEDDFILRDVNEAALGVEPETRVGKTGRELYPDFENVRVAMRRCLERDEVVRLTLSIPMPGVRTRTLELTIGPQQPDRVLLHAVDVTERAELEAQLRQAQKMDAVGRLAGGIAHDFNNILTVIGAHAAFLLDDLPAGSAQRDDAEAIAHAGDRAADLTRQLLAFSRKQILQPTVLDVNSCVTSAHAMLGRLLGEDIAIHLGLATDLPPVVADSGQVVQVIVNLALNARDAMPGGGRLDIRTSTVSYSRARGFVQPGEYVLLSVRDSGVGISEDVQQRLFEPFFTTKPAGKGTGLGLATVYGIVKQSGGYVTVDSVVGEGAEFLVHLPVAPPQERAEQPPVHGQGVDRGSETILLVEDESALRLIVKRVLQEHGYVVLEAVSGESALAIADAFDGVIHLVLTDAVMPGAGGAEVIRQLRERQPGVKAMMMSGYTDDEIARRGISSAEIPFIQKPFRPDALARAVREVLDS